MNLKRKGTNPITKIKNIPVIILSNFTIERVYNKSDFVVVEALRTRFKEVVIPVGMKIDLLINNI